MIKIRNLYKEVELELDKINFNNIWPGFLRTDFALYDSESVYLKDREITYDNRFIGNTSIDFDGDRLAIWQVENVDLEDKKLLAANIVHEMFHSYQFINNESRFPNDLKGLDYPMELNNFEIKYRENELIVSLFDDIEREERYEFLKEIIALRNLRRKSYGTDIDYEFAIETIEASAEYCGTIALKSISKDLYQARIEDYKDKLLNDIALLFDVRRLSYYSGTLFLLILDELEIEFSREIKGQRKSIFEEVSGSIKYNIRNTEDINYTHIEEEYKKAIADKENKFKNFFKQAYKENKLDAYICGYDPMNMIKLNNMILCSNFIMLQDSYTNEKLFLKGPLIVELEKDTIDYVREYYTS